MQSKKFSNSELDNLTLWDLPSVTASNGPKGHALANNKGDLPALPTVEEIEEMQKVAFEEASEQGWQEGYSKGLEEGRDRGFNEGRSELDQRVMEFRELVNLLDEPLKELDQQIEEELVELSFGIAKQLIRRELKTEAGQVVSVVRDAIQALPAYSRNIKVSMHPEDAELLRSSLQMDNADPGWNLVENPLLTRGGCQVETETSRIDASLENRIGQVIAAVLGGEREQDRQ